MRLRAPALRASVMRHRRIAAGVAAVVLVALVAGVGALALGSSGNPSATHTAGSGVAAGSASAAGQTTSATGSDAGSGRSASGSPGATSSAKPGPTLKPGTTATPGPNATAATTTISMKILPSMTWQPVKIPLSVGDTITFAATGSYRLSDTGKVLTPAGVGCKTLKVSNKATFPAPKLTAYALVGRSSGVAFCVGAGVKLTAARAGYMEVAINDDTRADDTGSVTISVVVTHRP